MLQPENYITFLSKSIKDLLIMLGPDITLQKLGNIKGLQVDRNGTVRKLTLKPDEMTKLFDKEFADISPFALNKLLSSLSSHQLNSSEIQKTSSANSTNQFVP